MSTFHQFWSRFLRVVSSTFYRLSRLIGNSLLYGSIFALIIWGTTYAMTGTKMLPNFLSSGVDFISFFSDTGTGNAGVDAKSYYARSNGSWIWYPGDNRNYLRNHTFLSGSLIDENNNSYYVNPDGTTNLNQLCINGVCKNTWGNIGGGNCNWTGKNFVTDDTYFECTNSGITTIFKGWPFLQWANSNKSCIDSSNIEASMEVKIDANGYHSMRMKLCNGTSYPEWTWWITGTWYTSVYWCRMEIYYGWSYRIWYQYAGTNSPFQNDYNSASYKCEWLLW